MGKLLDYIAKETQGECFASFKYCYDNMLPPNIEYEAKEDSYINMKEFAESIHDPHMRDMCPLAEKMRSVPPLFKFFLDGSRRVYKVDDLQYDKKVFQIVSGQISVSCCGRSPSTKSRGRMSRSMRKMSWTRRMPSPGASASTTQMGVPIPSRRDTGSPAP